MDTLLASSSPCPRTKAEPVKLSLTTVGTKRLEEMEDVLSIAPPPASTVRVCTLRSDALEHDMNLSWARGSMQLQYSVKGELRWERDRSYSSLMTTCHCSICIV